MAFIVLAERDEEFERRELVDAITIGRSNECDLPVRDLLLSRRHCRIEPHGRRWVLIDLGSKNGTRIGNQLVSRHMLENGEAVRIGHTTVCFREGPFIPAPPNKQHHRGNRPIDPYDAMSSTVAGIELADMEQDSLASGFPIPQPRPPEPKSYHEDGVGVLVAKIASGVWDTKVVEEQPARRAARALPSPPVGMWIMPAAKGKVDRRQAMRDGVLQAASRPVMREIRQAAPQIEIASQQQALARIDPDRRPRRWLILTYLGVAWGVFAASMCTLGWQFL